MFKNSLSFFNSIDLFVDSYMFLNYAKGLNYKLYKICYIRGRYSVAFFKPKIDQKKNLLGTETNKKTDKNIQKSSIVVYF